ncbi:MAG TPA: hypothetical protein VMP01_26200 [Pirellulaceae bacterium]|nr:hypothetical protein [Pirellulaceae bacterium]
MIAGARIVSPCDNPRMLINENIRKCVAFAGVRGPSDYTILGTAFFVVHRIEGTDMHELYMATARHVVESAWEKSIDGAAYFRLNEKAGTSTWVRIPRGDWEFHEDDKIDAAIGRLHCLGDDDFVEKFDHSAVGEEMFLTQEAIEGLRIRPGENLFFPGLFCRFPGNQANLPILRTGTIAALPTEQTRTSRGLARVYLAELRSIGGHSGSPVFVHLDHEAWLQAVRSEEFKNSRYLESYPFLGMVHGFFPIRADQFAPIVSDGSTETAARAEDYNSGIAAIVPASDIMHVLHQPALLDSRRITSEEIIRKRTGPTTET